MSVTTAFANQVLGLILEGTAIANVADNAASSPVDTLYISLHTASPGLTGTQETSETAYSGYQRQSIARSSAGWTVSSGANTNDSDINFPVCSANPGDDITHVGIGLSSSGSGTLWLFGALDTSFAMQVGTTPIFSATELSVLCS